MGAFGESTPDRAIFRKQSINTAKRIQAIVLYGGGGSWLTYSQNCSTVFLLLLQQCATENNLNKVANYDNGFHACHQHNRINYLECHLHHLNCILRLIATIFNISETFLPGWNIVLKKCSKARIWFRTIIVYISVKGVTVFFSHTQKVHFVCFCKN